MPLQILANQAVGVLVGASLPQAVRIAEVHGHPCFLGQLIVHRHLTPLVIGHAQPHGLRNAEQLVSEGLNTLAALAGLGCGSLMSINSRLVRSTSVPTALELALVLPLMRSPSQCASKKC